MNTTEVSFDRSRPAPRAIKIAILAMGGEGGGVLADWMVDMAEEAGYYAQTTSVPGVAQRTGATIYYLEMFAPVAGVGAGVAPVLGMMPTPGELDIVLASELMEAGRAVQRGLVTVDKTLLIASTHRVYSMTEKTAMADGRVDAQRLIEAGYAAAQRFVHADFARLAEQNGSVISAALFGALAGSGKLPFVRDQFEQAIRRGGVGIDTSLAAFNAGFAVGASPQAVAPSRAAIHAEPAAAAPGARLQPQATRIGRDFPAAVEPTLTAGVLRMADYQDEKYATDYLDRLAAICELDRRHGDGTYRLLNETARYLALWMSYEDTIRVADLKTRRSRFERVTQEIGAAKAQVVQINEFMHPRVEEIADTMPAALGRWLLATGWARSLVHRFAHKGRVIQTTSLRGYLLLYCVASLKGMRRKSLRFQAEHAKIAEWLGHIQTQAGADYALALEVAESQRLVKGYGDTHIRGTLNFDTLMAALPALRKGPDAASRLRRLREAALADDSGKQLAAMMSGVAA
ncbi:indolepyruvate oxidoreductase subunit B [Massilia eurypsychrophila]|jgi:indolepyruvate ferredoxin oxidoreductase beta subunit|uniref:Indolepyruvate oxidoreductase subunit B n=1 Tax=Massilia eurypsychrophila TaxID=1485217 RepID=A0A2G8TI88_9BURK|nr:indolepyruvate oxidoreductase subunit beta family protein [Massilia eurypsychrophila]PIL45761.1 indolepyruvate oxidoreductase subunit B [Massilia eurypsychrophila]